MENVLYNGQITKIKHHQIKNISFWASTAKF